MNYLDIIILVPLVWGIYKGATRGVIIEVASLIALVLGVWCAIHFSEYTADLLVNDLNFSISDSYLTPLSFALTFIGVAIAIVLVSRLLDKLLSAIALGGLVRFLGALFGAAKMLLILSILIYFVDSLDNKMKFIDENTKQSSFLYEPMLKVIDDVIPQLDLSTVKEKIPKLDI